MSHIDELQAILDRWRAKEKRKCKDCKHWDNWVYRLTVYRCCHPRWINPSSGVCRSQDGYYGYGVELDKNTDAENCKGFIPRGGMNMDFETEVRKLLAKVDAEKEKEIEPEIEPCFVCGGKMTELTHGDCGCSEDKCPMFNMSIPVSLHNALARVIKGINSLDESRPWGGDDIVKWNRLFKNRKAFQAICAKVREEM